MSSISIVFGAISGAFSARGRPAYIKRVPMLSRPKEQAALIIDVSNKTAAADFFRATNKSNIRFMEVPQ